MGELIRGKINCIECGSSDAGHLYQQDDGSVDFFCFSCETYLTPEKTAELYNEGFDEKGDVVTEDFNWVFDLECRGWRERRIGKEVSELYGIRTEFENGEVNRRFYPVTEGGEITGFRVRTKDKDFYSIGKCKSNSEFFGQSLFSAGGKFLVITGGQEDAASLQQALKIKKPNFTTAIVSPTNGEQSTAKQIKANFEWVTSFEKVIFMLDNDQVGKEATQEAVKLLKPGQAYIANLNLKDPNEYVKNHLDNDLVSAFWKAERYSPIDLMTLGDMWDDFEKSAKQSIIPFPAEFDQLNSMLGGGVAVGEVTVIGALTSIGKSAMVNNLVYSFFTETDKKIGLLYLESTPREIVSNLLSIHMEENLALKKPQELDMSRLKKEFIQMVKEDNRILSINHQGAFASMDDLFKKLEWMVKAQGTEIVVIDPIQAGVPSNDNTHIDEFMDSVLKLAKQTDATIFVVSHMRKPEGKDPHAVSEYELKGSSSINQISFNTILLSRDKSAEDENVRNSTRLQVVKCRRTGFTGEAGWLRYDPYKAKMYACDNPYTQHEPSLKDDSVFDSTDFGKAEGF